MRHAALAAGVVALFLAPVGALAQQEPDTTFDTRVVRPALVERAPRMLFDEAVVCQRVLALYDESLGARSLAVRADGADSAATGS